MSQNRTVTLSSEEYDALLAAYREVATIVWEDLDDQYVDRIAALDDVVEPIADRVAARTGEVAR